MTLTLQRQAPKQIVAGDSIEFLVPIPGDLTGWTGSARLTGASQMDATSVVVENGDFHVKFEGQVTGGTKALTAGQYTLTVWATSGNDRYTVLQHRMTVTPDLSTGSPALEHAMKTLTAVETAIYARLTGNGDGGVEEYAVEGTSVRKLSIDQLEKLRNKYSAEVARLQNPNAPLGRVKFVMTPAGTLPDYRRRYSP